MTRTPALLDPPDHFNCRSVLIPVGSDMDGIYDCEWCGTEIRNRVLHAYAGMGPAIVRPALPHLMTRRTLLSRASEAFCDSECRRAYDLALIELLTHDKRPGSELCEVLFNAERLSTPRSSQRDSRAQWA